MGAPLWKNVYDLDEDQIRKLEAAEYNMEVMQINEAERILMGM